MLDLDSILQVHSTSCDPAKPSYKKKEVYLFKVEVIKRLGLQCLLVTGSYAAITLAMDRNEVSWQVTVWRWFVRLGSMKHPGKEWIYKIYYATYRDEDCHRTLMDNINCWYTEMIKTQKRSSKKRWPSFNKFNTNCSLDRSRQCSGPFPGSILKGTRLRRIVKILIWFFI